MSITVKRVAIPGVLLWLAVSCTKDPAVQVNVSSRVTVETQQVSSIGQSTAASGVQVSGLFGNGILDKGICWSTAPGPVVSDSKQSGGAGVGSTALNLTGLVPATNYYVRGYAVTSNETIYGDLRNFSTLGYQLATLSTPAVSAITLTSASSGGNVATAGGGAVSVKGVCWSTGATPTTLNSKTANGAGTGAYISSLAGLNPGTIYYVRAYATNQAGTAYGASVSFKTASIQPPTLSGVTISAIAKTTASVSASVAADGGSAVTNRGICWSTSSGPTVPASRYSLNGAGVGAFSAALSGLSTGTTYYVRAYAINAAGTSYGTQSTFKTL